MTEQYIHQREDGQPQPVYHLVTHQPPGSTTHNIGIIQRETSPSTIMSVAKLPKKRKYDPAEIEEPVIEAKPFNQVGFRPIILSLGSIQLDILYH